jgi:ABC-type cobalamin/Fe3+-siderophores transport system ATPase subunit
MNTNQHNARGSEWRKWDLHIHTKETKLNNQFGAVSDNDLVEKIINSELCVVGLTNYFNFTDNDFAIKTQIESKRIVAFLNLELRLTYQNKENDCCDIHVLFDNTLENEKIKQVLNNLTVSVNGMDKKASNLNSQDDFTKGVVEFDNLISTLNDKSLDINGRYLIGFLSRGKGNARSSSVYEKITANSHFIIHSTDNQENIQEDKTFWVQKGKALIQSSDAHKIDDIGTKFTWIKADPTFEGLKQILYEPDERVRIQKTDPTYDFEKSPFTEIQISENVEIFENEQDNVTFEKSILSLNNSLVSIIGGRGTGKSILIDYIAAGLRQNIKYKNYTQSDKITIKRQTSLKDEPISFILSDNPNVPFMYISQSEIKSIVEKSQEFTKNIRETIGVIDNYNVSREYKEKADRFINEYFSVTKTLDTDGTNSQQKKEYIDKEVKRYNDFIANITSKENKSKLEKYQENIKLLERKKSFQDNLQKLRTIILQFENNTNRELQKINEQIVNLNLTIPLLNNSNTINYILNNAIPSVENSIAKTEEEINNTKNAFRGYTGDLATLLSDVALYQNKVMELQGQKKNIENNEAIFETIKQNRFKELGAEIENSTNAYKLEIENKWDNFKNGSNDYSYEQKQLLSDILGADNLNVSVEINFDTEKMYQLLMQKLDGRSWNPEKLERTLNITDLASYFAFIKQISIVNTFSTEINSIRSYVLDVLFRKYNEFIIHNIIVTSQNKNITKLSHGQQGTIYLRLKLAANLFSKTIIYDQPEDDLDNEFIMSDLVSIFRKIKKYRQIIIVSHNANLVVNADSEQIIIARNEDGVLKYVSGSLENTYINEQICKILEGGKSAFLNREKKYGLKK